MRYFTYVYMHFTKQRFKYYILLNKIMGCRNCKKVRVGSHIRYMCTNMCVYDGADEYWIDIKFGGVRT